MPHTTTLAYKYVMTTLIVAFINHYAPRLGLPISVPLSADQQAKHVGIAAPECDQIITLYGGGYREKNYGFGFNLGCCTNPYAPFTAYVSMTKLEDDGMTSFGIPLLYPNEPSTSLMERASSMDYKISSTNELYRIATNYLSALEIDVRALEATSPLTLNAFPTFHSDRGLVPNPIMIVIWGRPFLRDPGSNGIGMKFSAVSGELLELNAGIHACKGLPLIKSLRELLAIPDAEFLKYSAMQRSNLVARFAVNGPLTPTLSMGQMLLPPATNPVPTK